MSEPPEIKFGPAGVDNWDEINRWAMCNDVLWRDMQMHGRHCKLSEAQTLRLMAAALLTIKIKAENL